MRVRLLVLIPALILIAAGCGQDTPTERVRLIPMEDFFRNPEYIAPLLSPDGALLAFLAPWNNTLNIHVQDPDGGDPVRITGADRDIRFFTWGGNRRIVYVQDTMGDENYRLYALDPDGRNAIQLTPFENTRVQVIDDLRTYDSEILIAMNRRDPRIFDAFRLNIHTGELTLEAENPGDITGWMPDHDGFLRLATSAEGTTRMLMHRPDRDSPFRSVASANYRDRFVPLAFTPDNGHVYVSSNIDRDKRAIFRFDPEAGRAVEMVFEHPDVDVSDVMTSAVKRDIVGVAYATDRRRVHFLDPGMMALHDSLRALLPDYDLTYSSRSLDERRMIILAQSDRQMGRYYFYDRPAAELRPLFDIYPWLSEDEMAPMTPIQYAARDGLLINGYLTLPLNERPGRLPVVVLPHGGPWIRDHWVMNPEVQFFANRGYAVLQMNYRGSGGYGRSFQQAGFRQWGGAIQQDIADGVQWLIREGIADAKRIAIYGSSFGGYCALMNAARFPDLYKCAASYVGITDLYNWISSIPSYWELERRIFHDAMGDPETEREFIESCSPIRHADHYRVPLFVAHGANDPRISREGTDNFVNALRERGLEVEYILREDEGHGFVREENRFDLYRRLERFLARHIGG